MAFLTCSDEDGSISYTCFPKVYNLYNNITRGDVILVFGKVEKRLNELQIIVSKITKLN